jgi:hypothetical protein
MARTILQDVDRVMASKWYAAWALLHGADDAKIKLERGSEGRPPQRRPLSQDSWARTFIEAIRVGIEWETPPVVPPSLTELGRNVMFTAQNPEAALRLAGRTGWKVALTADPGPEGKWDTAVRAAAPKFKQAGVPVLVWGVQTQIGASRIRALAADIGAVATIFQAETVEEYDTAMAADAKLIIGNPNAWTQPQRDDAMYRGDSLATLFEVYSSNAGSPWPDAASSQGVPITCEVLGVGSWEGRPDVQLADYKPHTPPGVWQTMSVYLAENMNDESWGLLPEIGG